MNNPQGAKTPTDFKLFTDEQMQEIEQRADILLKEFADYDSDKLKRSLAYLTAYNEATSNALSQAFECIESTMMREINTNSVLNQLLQIFHDVPGVADIAALPAPDINNLN